MKVSRRMLILVVILILSMASMAFTPKYPHAGVWKGMAADGAKNQLRVTVWQNRYNVAYQDGGSAACGGGAAKGQGAGRVVGNVLVTAFTVKCAGTGVVVATNYNVGLVVGAGYTTATDAAGTSYNLIHSVGCSGR
jgi:hypothetical protein